MVVDDHPMWRDAIARDLTEAGYDVVASAADGAQALRIAGATRPDVVVLDLQLPDMSGVEVTRGLRAAHPAVRVLVLSASGEQQDVLDAVKAGAVGYLLKSAARPEFLDAVRRTADGDAVFTPGLPAVVLGEFRRLAAAPARDSADAPRLTERETEILRMVATGRSYKQIATRLVLSHRTVQNHVQNTLSKLHLHNRVELVRYAIEHGLAGESEERADGHEHFRASRRGRSWYAAGWHALCQLRTQAKRKLPTYMTGMFLPHYRSIRLKRLDHSARCAELGCMVIFRSRLVTATRRSARTDR